MRSRAERTLGSYLCNIGRVLDLHLPLFNKQTGNVVIYEGEVVNKDGEVSFLFKAQDGKLIKLGITQVHVHLTNKPPETCREELLSGYLNVQYRGPRVSYQTSITRRQNGMPFKSEEEAMQAQTTRMLTLSGDPVYLCKLTPLMVTV